MAQLPSMGPADLDTSGIHCWRQMVSVGITPDLGVVGIDILERKRQEMGGTPMVTGMV